MNNLTWKVSGWLCVLLAVLVTAGGCWEKKAGKQVGPVAESGGEEHGVDDGHGHAAKPAGVSPESIDERALVKCEHAIPIYQCAECRYEAGVVRLDASLMKKEDGSGLVRTQTVALARMPVILAATGEVTLNENTSVHISPRIPGIIESVSVDVGARVKAGDLLLTVASVELGTALAAYERNRSLSALSEKIFAREKRLWEQKVGAEQDMINAQMIFEQHRTELKASEQRLHVLGLSEDELAQGSEPLHGIGAGCLPVRAPAAGTIIEKHAVAGEMAEPGKDIMLLADLKTVWVWANVHSRDLARLLEAEKLGSPVVEISVAAFPDRKFGGVIDYVGATMNEQTRMVKVRATVSNSDLGLRPGMFCEVAITLGPGQAGDVLTMPRTAVFMDEGKAFVFKYWKDDFFVRQDVRTGREFSGMAEILEGLQAGDTVVTDGAFLLKSDILREKMGAGCAD